MSDSKETTSKNKAKPMTVIQRANKEIADRPEREKEAGRKKYQKGLDTQSADARKRQQWNIEHKKGPNWNIIWNYGRIAHVYLRSIVWSQKDITRNKQDIAIIDLDIARYTRRINQEEATARWTDYFKQQHVPNDKLEAVIAQSQNLQKRLDWAPKQARKYEFNLYGRFDGKLQSMENSIKQSFFLAQDAGIKPQRLFDYKVGRSDFSKKHNLSQTTVEALGIGPLRNGLSPQDSVTTIQNLVTYLEKGQGNTALNKILYPFRNKKGQHYTSKTLAELMKKAPNKGFQVFFQAVTKQKSQKIKRQAFKGTELIEIVDIISKVFNSAIDHAKPPLGQGGKQSKNHSVRTFSRQPSSSRGANSQARYLTLTDLQFSGIRLVHRNTLLDNLNDAMTKAVSVTSFLTGLSVPVPAAFIAGAVTLVGAEITAKDFSDEELAKAEKNMPGVRPLANQSRALYEHLMNMSRPERSTLVKKLKIQEKATKFINDKKAEELNEKIEKLFPFLHSKDTEIRGFARMQARDKRGNYFVPKAAIDEIDKGNLHFPELEKIVKETKTGEKVSDRTKRHILQIEKSYKVAGNMSYEAYEASNLNLLRKHKDEINIVNYINKTKIDYKYYLKQNHLGVEKAEALLAALSAMENYSSNYKISQKALYNVANLPVWRSNFQRQSYTNVRGANIRGSAGRVGYAQASTVPVQPAANINISINVEASGIILNSNGGLFANMAVQELVAVLQTHDARIGNALQEYLTTYSRGNFNNDGFYINASLP